jgi:hypothetical protein
MGTDGSYYKVTTHPVAKGDHTYDGIDDDHKPIGCLPTVNVDMTPYTKYTVLMNINPGGHKGELEDEVRLAFVWQTPAGKSVLVRHMYKNETKPEILPMTWTMDNTLLKSLLVLGGPLTFTATAHDPGSDDLAFVWMWGDRLPYTICIYTNPGVFYTCVESDQLNMLPFKDAPRSPQGGPTTAHDTATHRFCIPEHLLPPDKEYTCEYEHAQQYWDQYARPGGPKIVIPYYYVTLLVADDDNGMPYPSHFFWSGTDMQLIQIDTH